MKEVPEWMVRKIDEAFPDDAAAAVLRDAEEIKSRGNVYRFLITDKGEICVQEGVVSSTPSAIAAHPKEPK